MNHPPLPNTSCRKQAFHLSSAAYGALTAPITSSGSSGASGASTLGLSLGASTLSTLESFVQLPGGAHLASWGLGSVITSQPSGPSSSPTSKTESGRPESEKELVGKSKSDPAGVAAKGFCAALVMLKYDVAYLAHTQGVRVDLLGAAGSSLRLLARTLASGELGR